MAGITTRVPDHIATLVTMQIFTATGEIASVDEGPDLDRPPGRLVRDTTRASSRALRFFRVVKVLPVAC